MAQSWATINRRRKVFERKYSRLWAIEYREAGQAMIDLIERFGTDAQSHIDSIAFPGLVKLWVTMYQDVGKAFALDAYRMGRKSWTGFEQKAGGYTADESILIDSWTKRMALYAMEEAGEFIVSIQRTARDEMRRIVGLVLDDAFAMGSSRDSMASMIAEMFRDEWGKAAEWMGRRVAQTEMIRASNYATLEGIDSLGIPYDRVWYSGGANVRPTHEAANNQTVDSEEPFRIGEPGNEHECWYPGDPSLPPEESINCKCAVSGKPKGGY